MTTSNNLDFIMSILGSLTHAFQGVFDTLNGTFGAFILQTNNAVADPTTSAFLDLVKLIADNFKIGGVPLSELSVLAMMIGTGLIFYIILQTVAWVLSWIPVL